MTLFLAVLLLAAGLMLSALFSGAEIGFYRLSRARLLIDALEGNWISRLLLWAVSNPSVFVATILVGNNVANYITSLAIVMGAIYLAPNWPPIELIAPLLFAPVIFVYGELLPKNVFLAAPNRLLRRCGPPLAVAAVLFAPISGLLWLFNKLIETIGQKSPEQLRMVLARRELGELLDEGQAVGLLRPTQQALAQTTLALGGQPIANFMLPATRFPRIHRWTTPQQAAQLARRTQQAWLPVEDLVDGQRQPIGYVQASDCLLEGNGSLHGGSPEGQADTPKALPIRPLLTLDDKQSYLATLSQMHAEEMPIARLVNRKRQTSGYITLAQLDTTLLAE